MECTNNCASIITLKSIRCRCVNNEADLCALCSRVPHVSVEAGGRLRFEGGEEKRTYVVDKLCCYIQDLFVSCIALTTKVLRRVVCA